MSEKDNPGSRNSGSGDIGYGFVDLGRPGFEQSDNGLRNGRQLQRCTGQAWKAGTTGQARKAGTRAWKAETLSEKTEGCRRVRASCSSE
jgi:hypothetical protein